MKFDLQAQLLVGEHGILPVAEPDEVTRKLASQGIDPTVPWLYNYRLDFRFR